jgi:hypothetical protein
VLTDSMPSDSWETHSAHSLGASIQRTQAGGCKPLWWHLSCSGKRSGSRRTQQPEVATQRATQLLQPQTPSMPLSLIVCIATLFAGRTTHGM